MTEQTTEQATEARDDYEVHMQATFHDEHHQPEEITLTIADPEQPLIIISIGACPSGPNVMDIGMDVSGFKGPAETIEFLEQMIQQMKTTPAEQVMSDGSRVPFDQNQPAKGKSE